MKKLLILMALMAICLVASAGDMYWHTQKGTITSRAVDTFYVASGVKVQDFTSHIYSRFRITESPAGTWLDTTKVYIQTKYSRLADPISAWVMLDSIILAEDDTVIVVDIYRLDSLGTGDIAIGQYLRAFFVVHDTVTATDTTFDTGLDWRWELGFF